MSVIIPVYNLARYLPEAIESALAQTLPAGDVEVVVVDDGSTDGSGEVARRYGGRVRVCRQDNRGLSAARNAGLRATTAPFVNFLDADDRLLPEKLAAQLAVFEHRPDVGVVTAGVRYVDEAGVPLPPQGWAQLEGDVLPQLVLGNVGPPHALLVRREPIAAAGGFDETLASAEDWDLWLRLARAGVRWALVDRPLVEYRVRPDAMHQHPERMAQSCLRVLDKLFADPGLPGGLSRLRPLAYQNVALVAACDHYRAGDRGAATRWLRTAVRAHPAFLTGPRAMRRLCRLLLPVGGQSDAAVLADWRRLTAMLDAMLGDLFASPHLEPEIARLRRRARLAYWRIVARCRRKALWR
ncbi:MAG TPA: glycosyltransferase [Candidatus Binatia bacterium]|nr:glycosyltransferase [Candidatus Binatia bacterium]